MRSLRARCSTQLIGINKQISSNAFGHWKVNILTVQREAMWLQGLNLGLMR